MMRGRRRAGAAIVVALMMVLIGEGTLTSCVRGPGFEGPPFETVIEPFEVLGPTGNRIYGQLRRPDPLLYPDRAFPAVVLVSGGINPGRMEVHGKDAEALSEEGMVVVAFNAEGRVDTLAPDDLRSEGDEDFNGFRHQDGLARIVEYIAEMDGVDPDNVGLKSQSYGITMAAGCVGRYPELPVKYLVDGEGPSTSFVTCHGPRLLAGDTQKYAAVREIFGRFAAWQDPSPESLDWWSEREAISTTSARFAAPICGFRRRGITRSRPTTKPRSRPTTTRTDGPEAVLPGGTTNTRPTW